MLIIVNTCAHRSRLIPVGVLSLHPLPRCVGAKLIPSRASRLVVAAAGLAGQELGKKKSFNTCFQVCKCYELLLNVGTDLAN